MAISPDGLWLVTASRDNTARLWKHPPLSELIALARRTAGRELTDVERRQYLPQDGLHDGAE